MNALAQYLLAGYRSGFLSCSQVRQVIASYRAAVMREISAARSGSCNPCGGGYMMDSRGGYRENFGS